MARRTLVILFGLLLLAGAGAKVVSSRPAATAASQANIQDEIRPDETRIVAMSPAVAVILADLGLRDRIVGRHAFDQVLDESIPIAGDMNGIDYERLLRAAPTHVFLQQSAQEMPERLRVLSDENGWTLLTLPLLTLDDIPSAVEMIADVFPSDETERLAAVAVREVHESMRADPTIMHRAGKVLPLYWTNPPGAAGPGSFHFEILDRLGFELALTEGGPYITLDPEDILRMDPDSILLLMPGADPDRLEELLGPLAKLDLRCVREGRVAVIGHPLVNIPATSITEVVREIAGAATNWSPLRPESTESATN